MASFAGPLEWLLDFESPSATTGLAQKQGVMNAPHELAQKLDRIGQLKEVHKLLRISFTLA